MDSWSFNTANRNSTLFPSIRGNMTMLGGSFLCPRINRLKVTRSLRVFLFKGTRILNKELYRGRDFILVNETHCRLTSEPSISTYSVLESNERKNQDAPRHCLASCFEPFPEFRADRTDVSKVILNTTPIFDGLNPIMYSHYKS